MRGTTTVIVDDVACNANGVTAEVKGKISAVACQTDTVQSW